MPRPFGRLIDAEGGEDAMRTHLDGGKESIEAVLAFFGRARLFYYPLGLYTKMAEAF